MSERTPEKILEDMCWHLDAIAALRREYDRARAGGPREKVTILLDRDGDSWDRFPDGRWYCVSNPGHSPRAHGITLEELRHHWGPLHKP